MEIRYHQSCFFSLFRMLADNAVEIVLNERKVYEVDWLEDSYKRVSNNFEAKLTYSLLSFR